jgi:hypothetical protein
MFTQQREPTCGPCLVLFHQDEILERRIFRKFERFLSDDDLVIITVITAFVAVTLRGSREDEKKSVR